MPTNPECITYSVNFGLLGNPTVLLDH